MAAGAEAAAAGAGVAHGAPLPRARRPPAGALTSRNGCCVTLCLSIIIHHPSSASWSVQHIPIHHLSGHLSRWSQANTVAPVLYASQWFLTLFACPFPSAFSARVIDIILTEGHSEILLQARHCTLPLLCLVWSVCILKCHVVLAAPPHKDPHQQHQPGISESYARVCILKRRWLVQQDGHC